MATGVANERCKFSIVVSPYLPDGGCRLRDITRLLTAASVIDAGCRYRVRPSQGGPPRVAPSLVCWVRPRLNSAEPPPGLPAVSRLNRGVIFLYESLTDFLIVSASSPHENERNPNLEA